MNSYENINTSQQTINRRRFYCQIFWTLLRQRINTSYVRNKRWNSAHFLRSFVTCCQKHYHYSCTFLFHPLFRRERETYSIHKQNPLPYSSNLQITDNTRAGRTSISAYRKFSDRLCEISPEHRSIFWGRKNKIKRKKSRLLHGNKKLLTAPFGDKSVLDTFEDWPAEQCDFYGPSDIKESLSVTAYNESFPLTVNEFFHWYFICFFYFIPISL